MAKSINGWSQGTMKKPTDDRTMPDVPRHFVRKCPFCDGHEGHYTGITETMHIKLKDNLLVAVGVTNSDLWQIKYCPMCGRKLNNGKA